MVDVSQLPPPAQAQTLQSQAFYQQQGYKWNPATGSWWSPDAVANVANSHCNVPNPQQSWARQQEGMAPAAQPAAPQPAGTTPIHASGQTLYVPTNLWNLAIDPSKGAASVQARTDLATMYGGNVGLFSSSHGYNSGNGGQGGGMDSGQNATQIQQQVRNVDPLVAVKAAGESAVQMHPTYNLNQVIEAARGPTRDVNGVITDQSGSTLIRTENGSYIQAPFLSWTRTGLAADLNVKYGLNFTRDQENFINQSYEMSKPQADAFFKAQEQAPAVKAPQLNIGDYLNPLAYPTMWAGAAQVVQKGISDVADIGYGTPILANLFSGGNPYIYNAQVAGFSALANTVPFVLSIPYGVQWSITKPTLVLPKAYEMGGGMMEQLRIQEFQHPGSIVGTAIGMWTGGKLLSPYVPQLPAIRYGEFELPIETPKGLPKTRTVNVGAKPVLTEVIENSKVKYSIPAGTLVFTDVMKEEPIQYYAKYKGLYLDTNYKLPLGFKTGDYYAGKTPIVGIGTEAGGKFGSAMRDTPVIGPVIEAARSLPVTSQLIDLIESRTDVPTGLWFGKESPRAFGISIEPRISGAVDFLSNQKAEVAYQKLAAVEHLIDPGDVSTLKAIIELRDITSSNPGLITAKESFGDVTPVSMKPETFKALQDYMNANAKDMRVYGSLVGRVYLGEGGRSTLGDIDALLQESKAQFHADNMWDIYLKKEFGSGNYDISTIEKHFSTKEGMRITDILRIATKKGTGVYEPGVIDYSSPAYKNYMDAEVQYQQNFQSWMQRNKIPQQYIRNGLPYDPTQLRLAGITEPAPIRPRIEDFFPGKTVGGEVLSKLQSGSSQITGRRLMGLTPTGEHALDLHPISNLKYADTIPGTTVKSIPISDLIWGKQTIGNPPLGTITISRLGSDITIEAGGRVKDAFDTMALAQTAAADAYLNPKISLEMGMRLENAARVLENKVSLVDPMEKIGGYQQGTTLDTFLKENINPLERPDVQTAKFTKLANALTRNNRFFSGLPMEESGYIEDLYKDYGWDSGGFLPPINIGYYRNAEYKQADYKPEVYAPTGYVTASGYNPTAVSIYKASGYEPGNYKAGGYGLPEYKQGYTPSLTQGYNPTNPVYQPGLTPTYNPKVPYQPQEYVPTTPYTPQPTTPKTTTNKFPENAGFGWGFIPLYPIYPQGETLPVRERKKQRRFYRKFNEQILKINYNQFNPRTGQGAKIPYLETRKRGFLDSPLVIKKREAALPEAFDIIKTSQKMAPIKKRFYLNMDTGPMFGDTSNLNIRNSVMAKQFKKMRL